MDTQTRDMEVSASEREPRKKLGMKGGIALVVIGFAVFAMLKWCVKTGPQEEFSYIREKAEELGFDREKMITFVREKVVAEDYKGSSRGALGTLWGKSGNEIDRALLLQALLKEAEIESIVIRGEKSYGVKLLDSDELIALDADGGDKKVLKDLKRGKEMKFKPDLTIRFSGAEGKKSEREFRGNVADFLRTPLRISVAGSKARLIGADGKDLWSGSYDSKMGLSAQFTFKSGKRKPVTIWRELVPPESGEDARSEHVIVLAPCEIDQAIFEKQAELVARDFRSSPVAVEAYQLALSHWYQSDKALVDLRAHFQLDAWYAVPRVLIGSVYIRKNDQKTYALDLRQNDIFADVPKEKGKKKKGKKERKSVLLAFALARSAIEADLEARVMMEATGRRGVSGIDVVLAHLGSIAPSSQKRISDFERTLRSFHQDTQPGSVITLSAGVGLDLKLTKLKDGKMSAIDLAEPLEMKRKALNELPWNVIKSGKVVPAQFSELAVEIETLLGSVSEAGFDYEPGVTFDYSAALIKSPHVRSFSYRFLEDKRVVSFEIQFTSIRKDGSYRYEVIDYWDEITKKDIKNKFNLIVPKSTALTGNGITIWHNQRTINKGGNPLVLSRKAYRELNEQGYTDLVAYLLGGKATAPIRFYLIKRHKHIIYINEERKEVDVIDIGGRPVSEKKGKQAWEDIELMDDPKTPFVDSLNRIRILDDPEMPLIMQNFDVLQASVSGKILSTIDGKPVSDALVRVDKARVSSRSWPTGDFVLPIIKVPFAKFEVTVTHPDYETWTQTLDFKVVEELAELKEIRLKPRPKKPTFMWVQPESLEKDLAKLSDARLVRFIRKSLTDNTNLQAFVPLKEVLFGQSSEKAWLLLDRKSGHLTAVTWDGLHGAVGRLPGAAGNELKGGAISAYSGYIASWYTYSGGKIDAITKAMQGGDFSDLGHAHAKAFAMRFLSKMMESTDNFFAEQSGVNSEAYKAGFLKGLEFFDKNPAYRGE